jgi:hypothetical protein
MTAAQVHAYLIQRVGHVRAGILLRTERVMTDTTPAGTVITAWPDDLGHAPTARDLPDASEAAAILSKAQRLAAVRQQATAIIQANMPQPWDVMRHLASPEFQAWADDYLGLVAAELARLETAIENDQEATPDWPEVE